MSSTLATISRPACPLCESNNHGSKRTVDSHSIVICQNCKFEYVIDPIDWGSTPSNAKAKVRRVTPRHTILANFATSTGAKSVLEVGSGVGELGLVLRQQGFDYLGVEPDERRAISCQEAGLDVRATTLDGIPNEHKADLVVIDNVLEHVIDPISILKQSHTHLSPGGNVVVVVPNRKDIRRIMPAWREKICGYQKSTSTTSPEIRFVELSCRAD